VPLLYRTYAGNSSDQAVLTACLDGLRALHQSLDDGEGRERAQRTVVRDEGFWSPQLELDLDAVGYYSLISLPLGHAAAEQALQMAAKRGAMKPLTGKLAHVRAARVQAKVGNLDRTLVVVESLELLEGQKRGIAVALRKAKSELSKIDRLVKTKRISRSNLEQRIRKTLGREHLSRFVVAEIGGDEKQPAFRWHVDAALRRELEKTRLGRRVLCTDHHLWSTARIVQAFRGQWNVEELFRRAKKGGVVPWGPSHQWADGSIRLHTFATVLGLMLVSLAKIALGTGDSALAMMSDLAEIRATLVRTTTRGPGRRATVMIAPELNTSQRRAVKAFELDRWMPTLLSCMTTRPAHT
jgi:transposase